MQVYYNPNLGLMLGTHPGRALHRLISRSMASPSARDPGKSKPFSTGQARNPRKNAPPEDARIDALGRTMTKILRHQATDLNLGLRSDGFCKVRELLSLDMKTRAGIPLSSHTVDDVLKAVEQDNKQRFSTTVEDEELYIRANQGHSIKQVVTEELLKEIKSPQEVPVCVHGTYRHAVQSILKTGLKVMSRNHVHFATGLPSDGRGVISGMRSSCQVLIYLDAKKAMEDGMKLFMSDNNVVLTEGFDGTIPTKYFEKVVEWPSRKVIHLYKATE